jgi:NitT/TauT family transport system ATP-binding protein
MLQITGLTKSFGKAGQQAVVLHDICLDVPAQQFVCLLGASGCGKTTLLRIVAGLTKASAGKILVDDRPVTGPGQDRSMVFQSYGLLPWRTVMGNVELGLEVRGMPRAQRRELCRQHIHRVGLSGFENHYPHQISGGMQQRVALARAFSKDPKLLLMDEPFAAVDMQTREMLQEELLRIWMQNQVTVLFVTHSIDEAIFLGDRVVVMGARPGQIRADVLTELPRPRGGADARKSDRFDALRAVLRDALRADPAAAAP